MSRLMSSILCCTLALGPLAAHAESAGPSDGLSFAIPNTVMLAQNQPQGGKELNLSDLGFEKSQTAPDSELQKSLNERRFMLRQHQIWGLVTLGLLAGSLLSGEEGDAPPEHIAIGAATAATYGVSAYYALAAPDLPAGSKPSGGSLWHRRLAWVHGLGMIATPILGYMAKRQVDRGEGISGAAAQHKNVAGVTAGALAVSVALVSFEF